MLDEMLALVATNPIKEPLSYLVPKELESTICIGSCVKIPLGKRQTTGFVISLMPKSVLENSELKNKDFKIKAIISCIKDYPVFLKEQLDWFNWMANYYSSNIAAVLETAVPSPAPDNLQEVIISLNSELAAPRALKARTIIEFLSNQSLPYPLKAVQKQFANSAATIKKLKQDLYIQSILVEQQDQISANSTLDSQENLVLNKEQKIAANRIIESIDQNKFKPYLLHGITGSGKTEVYLQSAQQALKAGKSVLILVPEISLTPQLIDRFSARLNQPIAVLHSAVNKSKRWQAWKNLAQGKYKVCLGARSAVFAPIHNLGLVLVDEEHDASFKQSEGIRYNGRDIAIMRAKFANCPVVLGSATPSLESLSNANKGRYEYLSLPYRPLSRANASIEIIDLNKVSFKKMVSKTISPMLHEALSENLKKGEQSFLLYNRRGFASYLQCQLCFEAACCPNCSVSFTLHSTTNSLVCHYCGLSQAVPKYCGKCKPDQQALNQEDSKKLPLMQARGAGTEKAYDEIKELFPQAKVERLDRDSVSSTEDLVNILNKVRNNECHILVGTQMIAKGHDIPNVTLVGVLDCDIGLHMPDFRAPERVFNLITQVAGRAGRGELAGKVLLQTRLPNHPVLQYALNDNYLGFANYELLRRQELNYPPFGKLLRIVISDLDQSTAKKAAETMAAMLMSESAKFNDPVCLGPVSCSIEKLRGHYRFHILLKNESSAALSKLTKYLKEVYEKLAKGRFKNLKIIFDLDPIEML